jgi:hypothetical protein
MTIFYCPRLETPPPWSARSLYLYPSRTGWPSYNSRDWVPFHCLLWLAGLRWWYSNPPPHGVHFACPVDPRDISSAQIQRKTLLPTILLLSCHIAAVTDMHLLSHCLIMCFSFQQIQGFTNKFRDWVHYAHLKARRNMFHLVRVSWLFQLVPCTRSVTSLMSFMKISYHAGRCDCP